MSRTDKGVAVPARATAASQSNPQAVSSIAGIPNADDGWTCVHCRHPVWRFRLGNDRLIECNSCGAIHTFSGVLEARKYRDLDRYYRLLFAVERKFPGEERHETALRYIREREAQGMSAGTAETAQQAQGEARQPGPKDAPQTQSGDSQ